MENKKESEDIVKKHIEKIVKPIFEKAAQETKINHTMVDNKLKTPKKTITPSLYNPHNYRLYFTFTKEKYKPKVGMVGVWFGKFKNYDKEFTAVGEGIRVTIKKTQAEIINKLSEQEWFLVNRVKGKEEITAILNKIDAKCISSFKKFIEIYGGHCDFIILKREGRPSLNLFTKSDNKIMREPFIDSLPLDMTFETDRVKKYYKKPEVEFKTPLGAANYLENSALNEFAPEIAQHLVVIKEAVFGTLQQNESTSKLITEHINFDLKEAASLHEFHKDVKVHNKVLKGIDKSFRKFNRLLSDRQKKLGEWL